MMSEANCKVHVVSGTMNFEIAGPENFVRETVELFKDQLRSCFDSKAPFHPAIDSTRAKEGGADPTPAPHVKRPGNLPEFQNVLHIEGTDVKVLKTPSTNTTSKKAVCTALLFLWGKRAVGVDSVPFSEVRTVCKEHGCLDEKNFAKSMRSVKEWIIVDDKMLKLTVPGVNRAEEILAELNGPDSK